jgi:hypothetical protein
MKTRTKNSDDRNTTAIKTIGVTMLVASLLTPVAINNADAAKGNSVKAPAPRTAALTAQEKINRTGTVRPVEPPQKMSLDRKCKGPHRPHSCFPHQH